MKNRSHRYNINRPRPKHGHKYTSMYLFWMPASAKLIKKI